jgi:hypothetical protein
MFKDIKFRRWFLGSVAILLLFGYFYGTTFIQLSPEGAEMAKEYKEPLMNITLLMFGYFWGSSDSDKASKDTPKLEG